MDSSTDSPSRRSIPWPRILAEGAVIVVSILLALTAESLWSAQSDRAEEQELLAGIRQDFLRNQQEWSGAFDHHQRIYDAGNLLLDAQPSECSRELDEALEVAVLQWRTFNQVNGAAESVVASGRLSLIRDLSLRASLAAWDGVVADLVEDEIRTLERRDSLAEYTARESPQMDCTSLLGDETFKALLRLPLFEEREVFTANDQVPETISGVLEATGPE